METLITGIAVAGLVVGFLLAARPETLPGEPVQPTCARCKEFISWEWAADQLNKMLCEECQAKSLVAWELAQTKTRR